MNAELIFEIFFIFIWGFFCFYVGRISKVNAELNKHWPEREEFHKWKMNKENEIK